MKVLCKIGFHWWQENGIWAGRKCKICHAKQVLYYDKESGSRWVKVQ